MSTKKNTKAKQENNTVDNSAILEALGTINSSVNSIASNQDAMQKRLTDLETNKTNGKKGSKSNKSTDHSDDVLNQYEESGLLFQYIQYANSQPGRGHYVKISTTGAKSPCIGDKLAGRSKSMPIQSWYTLVDLILTELEVNEFIEDKSTVLADTQGGIVEFVKNAYANMLASCKE